MEIPAARPFPDTSANIADRAKAVQRSLSGGSTGGVTEKQRQQAKKVAQDFEALFVGMMMKSMRETVGKDKLTGGGHGDEVFRSMLDQEYAAASVKRGGGLGLAKNLEKEIIRQQSRINSRGTVDTRE